MNKLNKIILCLLFTSFLSAFTSWAQTLQIEQKSYLFLCSEWPPYEYMSKNKKPIGFSVEVLEEMSKVVNIKSEIKFYPWARAYSLALNTKDVAVFTMARTKVREKIFKWVGPISDREIYMWKLKKKENIKVNNIEDIKHYLVATVRDEAGEKQLLSLGFTKDKNIFPFASVAKTYQMLYAQRIDFIYGLEFTTLFGLKKLGYDINEIEKTIILSKGLKYYYGFNINTSDEVINQYQKALDTIKENGIFDKIVEKYKNIKSKL